jgi:starvation-inducible DNA-binding protein
MNPELGVSDSDRGRLAKGLSKLLADSYTLYLETHNFHWNVTGPSFPALHMMFETQYNELALAVDEVAERIRTLGHPAPATYAAFLRLSSIKEPDGVPEATEMVRLLAEGHEAVAHTAGEVLWIADHAGDQATADLATQRLRVHEKTTWMLRSTLAVATPAPSASPSRRSEVAAHRV